jgi:hypothetical protein
MQNPSRTRMLGSVAAFLGLAVLVSQNAPAASLSAPSFNAPNIPAAGFPEFTSNVSGKVFQQGNGDFVLEAGNGFGLSNSNALFNLTASNPYAVQRESYSLFAEFNPNGTFKSGYVSIYGAISGLGLGYQNLYTANIIDDGLSFNSLGVGFKTTNANASGWASQFQTGPESVYLYNFDFRGLSSFGRDSRKSSAFFFNAREVTTVPLPAAGLLLVSGLAALARRRRAQDGAGALAPAA